MQRKPAEVVSGLKRKGFVEHSGDHRYFFYYTTEGKKTSVRTKVSHSSKTDIQDGLLNAMSKQCRLETTRRFVDLVDCPLSREDYEKHLIDNRHIEV